ncbi:hypothetical protein [Bacillus infantis]|uniref:hypothetical protein n=1 Tax=Bacillus infantis TaxID=324767 RepID=UPI002002A039|nr:hypothetical protein [Bacillus infantis]MCK6208454.1 hypothetical protein [Bacillus infantis]MCP1161485.1 hypothetical protein [Bacillus infantis]
MKLDQCEVNNFDAASPIRKAASLVLAILYVITSYSSPFSSSPKMKSDAFWACAAA